MRRSATAVALVALTLSACASGGERPPARLQASAPTTSSTSTSVASTTTADAATVPPTITTTSLAVEARRPKVPVPISTLPEVTVPPLPTTDVPVLPSVASSTTTEPPLPVPELFDVVQGIGTPCTATPQRPDGCWFFVYATLATRTWTHHVYSDAATTPWVARDNGKDCGDEAQPHHRERDGCSFYFGPVHGRTAGQRECFTATTVSGARESERSKPVCLTWSDHRSPNGAEPAGS